MTIQVRGRVIDDDSEHGLTGVSVTNGEQIVQTDGEGRYELDVETGTHRFVFITVPDGFSAQDGYYRSTPDVSEAQDGVDFRLSPSPARSRRSFTLAQITDTHIVTEGDTHTSGPVLSEALRQIEREAKPDLIIASGDLTDWGTIEQLTAFRDAVRTISTPVFPLFGGHDGNQERMGGISIDEFLELKATPNNPKLAEIGRKFAGLPATLHFEAFLGPTYYSLDWGGRHFAFFPNEDAYYPPADLERKAQWLRADLALQPPDREIVVVVHTPPPGSFLRELSRYNVRLVLHGHWHSSKVCSYGDMVVSAAPPVCFGGIDTSPRGYRVVQFSDGDAALGLRVLQAAGAAPKSGEISPRDIGFGSGSLRLRWERKIPGGIHRAAPVSSGERVFLSLRDEGWPVQAGVCCLDAASGEMVWHAGTDAAVKNSVAVDGSACAAVSITGRVQLLDAGSGATMWEADLPEYPERWIYSAPVIADGTVYAGEKAGYAAFDLASGRRIWHSVNEDGDNWACYASPQVSGDLLLLLVQRRGLVALDRATGDVVWERQAGVEFPYARPVLAGDLLVSGGGSTDLHHFSGEASFLIAVEKHSGGVVWERQILPSRYPTGLLVRDDRIYATTPEGEALCFGMDDGAMHWRFRTGDDLLDMVPYRRGVRSILAAPVMHEGSLIVCGCDGLLYVLDPASGRCLDSAAFGSPITASPCTVDRGLVVGTFDGRVFCFGWDGKDS
ncbi:MAG: PQQ-binding-like beta-propeller repeat protein [Gemmatimonadota bacterium]|nr:PQQ-binding-like beta-propeller repeat protein [Gemmatimonadota bacterium]